MHGGQAMLKAIERAESILSYLLPARSGRRCGKRWRKQRRAAHKKPRYINCRHEAVAVAMAAGYTKVTDRPQVVMLHATAGPLNAAMTLRAALHERTPMVIISGEIAAYGENTKVADPGGQWLHDLTDSAARRIYCAVASNGPIAYRRPNCWGRPSNAPCASPWNRPRARC